MASGDTFTDPAGIQRVKDTEIVIPIVLGTASFHLGKKATDTAQFRWTVYVRHVDNEDLSYLFEKVVFQLHESFLNSTREVMEPPYELTEQGWGEFEIVISLHFKEDAGEKPVELVHKLKLYADDAGGQISKKPVVHEQLEELVFSEPASAFHGRVSNQVAVPSHPYSVANQFTVFDPEAEVQRYNAVRQKVGKMRANAQRQLEMAI